MPPMTMFIRLLLTLPCCVAFCAAVAVAATVGQFGLKMLPFTGFYWGLLVAGALAGFLSALLAPGWKLKWKLLLAVLGGGLGSAAGGAVGYIVEQHPTPLALGVAIALWGAFL